MKKTYKRKPVVESKVEAIQWTGKNQEEIEEFLGVFGYVKDNSIILCNSVGVVGKIGDYVVKGMMGMYTCYNATRFLKKYEEVK